MHEQKGMYSVIRNAAVYTMAAAGLVALVSGSASAAPNKITLPSGEAVCDVRGKWDATYKEGNTVLGKDIINITQYGNSFEGITTIGGPNIGKGNRTIKGKLKKDGFSEAGIYHSRLGWLISTGDISYDCNNIKLKTPGYTVILNRS